MNSALGELIDAIENRDETRLKRLLEAQPSLAAADPGEGMAPLVVAIYWRNDSAADALVAAGAPYPAPLAAARGDVARLTALAHRDPEALADWSADGWSALHLAAHFGHVDACLFLLRYGASPSVRSRNGLANLPVHAAAAGNHTAVVGILLAAGTGADERQHGGWTALHQAAQHGNEEMARWLLAGGADARLVNDEGKRPLDLVPAGHEALRRLLA